LSVGKKKKKKKEEEMDTKNLPRARTTIDIVWAHFWCDPARFSSVVVLRRGGGHGGSGEAEEKQTLRFPSHVVHVLHHNLLGQLHLLLKSQPHLLAKQNFNLVLVHAYPLIAINRAAAKTGAACRRYGVSATTPAPIKPINEKDERSDRVLAQDKLRIYL
jgi:hypothetical protein